jgi:uncharacterized protein YjbI with pentapeptide repeats
VLGPANMQILLQELGDPICFDRSRFRQVSFEDHPWKASYNMTRFEDCHFKRATFLRSVEFKGATFADDADFSEATFKEAACFDSLEDTCLTRFIGRASFDNTVFRDDVSFRGVVFCRDASFYANRQTNDIQGGVDFSNASFRGRAVFSNRTFVKQANFRSANFKVAPEFHNCDLHQDTEFSGAKFHDITSPGAIRSYRTLKLAMEKIRAIDEMSRFYALEQQSVRKRVATPISVRILSGLYQGTANYGQSFMMPFIWMWISAFVFLLVYALVGGQDMWGNGGLITFTLQQLFQPFAALREHTAERHAASVPLSLAIVAAIHSLLTLVFLALTLLAVRRRFKLD